MSRVLYYEALGETETRINEILNLRVKAKKKLHAWAKAHGGNGHIGASDNAFGFRWTVVTDDDKSPTNPENWKKFKGTTNQWQPRYSTKEGKRLAAEMKALADEFPSVGQIITFLGLPHITESMHITSIGVRSVKGGRVLLEIPVEKYKPPKGITLKRISDLEFEKLTSRKTK